MGLRPPPELSSSSKPVDKIVLQFSLHPPSVPTSTLITPPPEPSQHWADWRPLRSLCSGKQWPCSIQGCTLVTAGQQEISSDQQSSHKFHRWPGCQTLWKGGFSVTTQDRGQASLLAQKHVGSSKWAADSDDVAEETAQRQRERERERERERDKR
ncbi:hypothetical protein JZ751_029040 [Albula glossodonta]|uniref:Uncharacterized protein n=1 Tax=Albula glossodonta TaxID=121402 RepID=A0A8T2P5F3_9TELE|nr:hypothetical protein JZ751_029040 [Albula glossodonta]